MLCDGNRRMKYIYFLCFFWTVFSLPIKRCILASYACSFFNRSNLHTFTMPRLRCASHILTNASYNTKTRLSYSNSTTIYLLKTHQTTSSITNIHHLINWGYAALTKTWVTVLPFSFILIALLVSWLCCCDVVIKIPFSRWCSRESRCSHSEGLGGWRDDSSD